MKERLKLFLAENELSAKQFSDEIGVQASSISHILTGRNKPSVELLQKILRQYPDFNIYWLLTGGKSDHSFKEMEKSELPSDPSAEEIDSIDRESDSKEIIAVLCLYKDGSFEKFDQRS